MNGHPARARAISAWTRASGAVGLLAIFASVCSAGTFGVSPIRLDLDRNARTGSVTITNEDNEKPLRAQVEAMLWTQDADGKDHYDPTGDLIFLPRIMTVAAAESQLVRVGIRVPAADREKAYRLFIEEIPEARKEPAAPGAQVAVKLRFGIPVFANPLKEDPRGEIDKVEVKKGQVTVSIRNTGNVHFAIRSIRLDAGPLFSKDIAGWYLLPGATRTQTAAIPADVCAKLDAIDVTVKTDRLDLAGRVAVDRTACQ